MIDLIRILGSEHIFSIVDFVQKNPGQNASSRGVPVVSVGRAGLHASALPQAPLDQGVRPLYHAGHCHG